MRNLISAGLALTACLVIGDKLWTIALAGGLILAALVIQACPNKRRKEGRS